MLLWRKLLFWMHVLDEPTDETVNGSNSNLATVTPGTATGNYFVMPQQLILTSVIRLWRSIKWVFSLPEITCTMWLELLCQHNAMKCTYETYNCGKKITGSSLDFIEKTRSVRNCSMIKVLLKLYILFSWRHTHEKCSHTAHPGNRTISSVQRLWRCTGVDWAAAGRCKTTSNSRSSHTISTSNTTTTSRIYFAIGL